MVKNEHTLMSNNEEVFVVHFIAKYLGLKFLGLQNLVELGTAHRNI